MTPEGMKELQEALAVTNRIQNRHALMIEDHQRWLEAMQTHLLHTSALVDQIAASDLAARERMDKLEEDLKRLQATVQAFIDSLRRGGNGRG